MPSDSECISYCSSMREMRPRPTPLQRKLIFATAISFVQYLLEACYYKWVNWEHHRPAHAKEVSIFLLLTTAEDTTTLWLHLLMILIFMYLLIIPCYIFLPEHYCISEILHILSFIYFKEIDCHVQEYNRYPYGYLSYFLRIDIHVIYVW